MPRFHRYTYILLILVVAALVRLPLVARPLTATSDPWRETDTASIAHNFYDDRSFNIFYPQINWGGDGPGYVETEFQLYPFITSLLYLVFGEQPWVGRLVSLGFFLLTLAAFCSLARRLFNERIALWGTYFLAITPITLRYSTAFMPEATVLFFYVAALYLFASWLESERPHLLLLAGVSTALAILVKPTSIHIGLVFLLLLWERFRWRLFIQPRLYLFGLIALLPALLWYLHARDLYLTYGNTFGVISGGDSKFGDLSYWLSPRFYASVLWLDLRWVLAGAGGLLAAVGLAIYLRRRRSSLLLYGLVVLLPYYMLLARYTQAEWGLQYHVYAVPYAALAVGIGLVWLIERLQARVWWVLPPRAAVSAMTALAALAFMLVPTSAVDIIARPDDTHLAACGAEVGKRLPPRDLIIVSTTSRAYEDGVPNNYQEPEIFYYSHHTGWSLPADQHAPLEVEKMRRRGGNYLVIYSLDLLRQNPLLVEYLQDEAKQIGPGITAGCAIFRFHQTYAVSALR